MALKKQILVILINFLLLTGANAQSIETVVQAGHYASVTATCYSPDGKFIATGSSDKTIILWRSSDGKEIRSFRGCKSEISKLEFNRQGTALLSLDREGNLILWNIESGKIITSNKPADDLFTSASFHPGGELVITGSRKSGISVWDIKTWSKKIEIKAIPSDLYSEKGFDYPEAGSVSFSNDGQYIVAGTGDNTAIIWDASTGKELRKFKKVNSTCTSCICEAVITPDNKYVITASNDSVKVFDRTTGLLINKFYGQGDDPEGLTVSSDNRYIAGIEYGVAEIWDIRSGGFISLNKSR
jgi:WD40 repeat protein